MALAFGGGATYKVNVGAGSSLANFNTATYLAWVYRTGTADARVYCKGYFGVSAFRNWVMSAGSMAIDWMRGTGTTNLTYQAELSNFSPYSTNKWCFIGADVDNAVGGHLWVGDADSLPVEPSVYTYNTLGSGAFSDESAQAGIIGNKANDNASFDGSIAWIGIWNRQMTIQEIYTQWLYPHRTAGCVLFMHLGIHGAGGVGTQIDWSGNGNHGTITGATVAVGAPIRIFPLYTPKLPTSIPVSETVAAIPGIALLHGELSSASANVGIAAQEGMGIAIGEDFSYIVAGATITQYSFRWRNDDGDEDEATWKELLNTDSTSQIDSNIRLRVLLDTSGDVPGAEYQLEYRKVGDPAWTKVQ